MTPRRYAIIGFGQWYAGHADQGYARWTAIPEQAHLFVSRDEAVKVMDCWSPGLVTLVLIDPTDKG